MRIVVSTFLWESSIVYTPKKFLTREGQKQHLEQMLSQTQVWCFFEWKFYTFLVEEEKMEDKRTYLASVQDAFYIKVFFS